MVLTGNGKLSRAYSVCGCLPAVSTFHSEYYWLCPMQTLTTFNGDIVLSSLDLLFLPAFIPLTPRHMSLGASFNQSYSFHESW